jgi:hypothetical protein
MCCERVERKPAGIRAADGAGKSRRPPPVVYGSPYDGLCYGSPYNPPPVVHGPGIGIGLPGVNINIW